MRKERSGLGALLRQASAAGRALIKRTGAPLAIGLFASLSLVGHAGLPAKRVAAPASSTVSAAKIQPAAAAQIASISQVKKAATATQRKLDSALMLAAMKQRGDARLSSLSRYRFARPGSDGRFAVDITLTRSGDPKAVLEALGRIDAPLLSPKKLAFSARSIRARVALKDLEALAALKAVSRIRRAMPAYTSASRTPGPVIAPTRARRISQPLANALNRSEGVLAHGVDAVRSTYGASGQGQFICVLSDGIGALAASQASGDLPADITVLPGQAGSGDEGTAMLEIVHDMAPGARLGFATAFTSEASFAQNILDLAAAGCTIIVDDVIYLDESPWQDGPVAQAVNTVTAAGVLYFSSAGNEGNLTDGTSGTWEGDFRASPLPNPVPIDGVGTLHDFGDGGQSLLVESASGSGTPVVMIWGEHYTLDQGFAATDYDVYVLNNDLSALVDSSVDAQDGFDGDDFPVEFVGSGANPGDRVVVSLFSADGPPPPPFNIIVFRGEVDGALATSGATRGHSAAVDAFSTAATPAAASFDGTTPDGPSPGQFTAINATESFSADGPRKILLGPDGSELTPGDRSFATGGVIRQKPDITAADGVSTSAPGFSTFYGTSAAAPHAAAIAGLLRGAAPRLSMADIRATLNDTAIDIEAPGVDRDTGVGIVMPLPALAAVGATAEPILTAGTAVVTQVSGDGDGVIEPGETFAVSIPLGNIGAATATGVSATLSAASSAVTVISSTASYADVAVGGSVSNATALTFRVAPGFQCGLNIALTLSVAYNGSGSPQVFGLSQPTGSAGTPVTVAYGRAPVAIPDGGDAVDAPLTVAGLGGLVRDVNVSIDGASCSATPGATTVGLDHSYVGDLIVSLVSPAGTAVTLISEAGLSGNNFCQVMLDDQSAGGSIQGIDAADAPFTGSYTPATPLSVLNGEAGNGSWSLRAQDLAGMDVGSIRAWSVSVTPAVCDAVAAPTPPSVSSIVRAGSSPTNGASVSYAVNFSESVTGVDAGDFVVTGTGTLAGTSISSVTGTAARYSVTVATGTGSGTLRLDVADNDSIVSAGSAAPLGGIGAGNGSFTAGDSFAIDRDGPTATIAVAGGQPDPVTTAPVRFAVSFSESTTEFTADDVVVGGTAGATTAVVSGSGSAYTVSVSDMTGNGTVTARVMSGAIRDTAGNASAGSATASANFSGLQPNVGFTLATQSAVEGSTTGTGTTRITVSVSLSTVAGSDVTVPVNVSPTSTATLGDDYTLSAASVTIPAGLDSASLTVTVTRDLVEEADETIVLTLGTPTGGATLGTPSTQTITVVNDDDTSPQAFSFAPVTNAALGSVQTSAPASIQGINQAATITVSGGSYSISGGAFTSAPGTVTNGQTVTLRQTASSSVSTLTTATVSVGGVSAGFNVTTVAADTAPDAFSFAPVSGVVPGSMQTSGLITVTGINQPAPITISAGASYSINGGAFTSSAGSVASGQTVAVRFAASNAFSTASTATLTIGGVSAGFTVTTQAADTTPAAFAFAAVSGAQPGAVQTSNAITVQDINTAAPISISGGSYSINGGTFVTTAGTVNPGASVTVRVTASSAFGTPVTATLGIGGVSAGYTVTTRAADLSPDPFSFTAVTDAAVGAVVSSNAVTISGIEAATAISVSGGQYSINGGAFTAAAGTVSPGDSVVVRLTASGSNSTLAAATLAVGAGADQRAATFNVTTAAAPAGGGGGSAGGALLGFLGLAALWRRRRMS